MGTSLNLREFLTTVVIGVLFQGMLLLWLHLLGVHGVWAVLHALDASVVIALAFVLAFPFWRLTSNFVGYLMEPVAGAGDVWRRPYVQDFFGIEAIEDEERVTLLRSLVAAPAGSLSARTRDEIESCFGLSLSALSDKDLYGLFEMIKGVVDLSPMFAGHLQSERSNTASNFQARLAVLSNVGFWLAVVLAWSKLIFAEPYRALPYLIGPLVFFALGRHFGSESRTAPQGYRLLLADFMAVRTANKPRGGKGD